MLTYPNLNLQPLHFPSAHPSTTDPECCPSNHSLVGCLPRRCMAILAVSRPPCVTPLCLPLTRAHNTHVNTRAYIHTCVHHTQLHSYICTPSTTLVPHPCSHTLWCHSHTRTHVYTHTPTYTHVYIHAHTIIRTHMHTELIEM